MSKLVIILKCANLLEKPKKIGFSVFLSVFGFFRFLENRSRFRFFKKPRFSVNRLNTTSRTVSSLETEWKPCEFLLRRGHFYFLHVTIFNYFPTKLYDACKHFLPVHVLEMVGRKLQEASNHERRYALHFRDVQVEVSYVDGPEHRFCDCHVYLE